MSLLDAMASQGFDEPAKVEPARPDLAAIAANIARVRGHATDADCHLLRMCGVPKLGDDCEVLLGEVARLTRERDEARQLLQRIVKYAKEDRARTPGRTRLARALAEASALLDEAEVKP